MDRRAKRLVSLILVAILSTSGYSADPQRTNLGLGDRSLAQLEQWLSQIDSRLSSLAPNRIRSGIGVIGYRSDWRGSSDRKEWVEIELDQAYPIDEVVLVPTLSRDTNSGYQSDGFPKAIRILAGTKEDRSGTVIAAFESSDDIQPRIGPLVISVESTMASWVRIEATELSTRAFDGKHVFQLAEVFLFSDSDNVALRQKVTASSNSVDLVRAWDKQFLVDGHTPYLMDSSDDSRSLAYVSRFGEQPLLYLDLKSQYPISRIHLHAVDQDDTVPLAYAGDLGIPSRMKIEGAADKDFSNAETLLDYQRTNINDLGPLMTWRIPETTCQFVRVIAAEPKLSEEGSNARKRPRDIRIGFAEIELYANGENIALGKQAYADYKLNEGDRSPATLTDGKNMFGEILPIRTWLNELAERHDLEQLRPAIDTELNERYARQSDYLTWVTWLAVFLAAGIGVTFMIGRNIRMRQLTNLRNRFAADLHDELGADLHVIGLLSDLAKAAVDSPEKHDSIHQRIRTMTHRSGDAVRHCTNMLEAQELHGDLLEDMQRSTERIMADFDGEFSFQGDEAILARLKPRTRADLFLFYKESLVNISRHSNASHFNAKLTAECDVICITVCDDGSGITDANSDDVPASLMRRAKLLGANVVAQQPETGGTRIVLTMKTKRWGVRK